MERNPFPFFPFNPKWQQGLEREDLDAFCSALKLAWISERPCYLPNDAAAIEQMLRERGTPRVMSERAMSRFNGFWADYGKLALLAARLQPWLSFDAVSYVAGLTPISIWPFLGVTAIGALPFVVVYSWLGQSISRGAQIALWSATSVATMAVLVFMLMTVIRRQHVKKKAL